MSSYREFSQSRNRRNTAEGKVREIQNMKRTLIVTVSKMTRKAGSLKKLRGVIS